MADKYVRSTDGDNADDGSTWALAEADLHTPTWSAGDRIFVSDAHAQDTSAAISINLNGTLANPTLVICGDDVAEPPTAVATTGLVQTTGGNTISVNGGGYVYGLTFNAGNSSGTVAYLYLGSNDALQVFDSCNLQIATVNTTAKISCTSGTANNEFSLTLKNTGLKFANASQTFALGHVNFVWEGGSLLAGGTAPSTLFTFGGDGVQALISGVDLSNGGSSMNLFAPSNAVGRAVVRNLKLPASWTGGLTSSALATKAQRIEMYNCDSGDTNYRLWIADYAGSVRDETTIVRTGGASDGTTALAWKMTTSANAGYPSIRMESPEIVQWNDTTASSKTVTVEIVHDSQGAGAGARFQDDEAWLEVMYLGTSGFPLGTWINDCKANVLAAAADQTDSTETWTTTGLTTPVKQKLSVTFTPQEKGFIHARVVMAKASKTCYVDPKLTVA